MDRREREREEEPRSTTSWVRSAWRSVLQTSVVVVAAAAPASSNSCRILTPASDAAFSSPARWVSENQAGAVMTAPWIFLPRKSSADWMRDLMKMVVTSETVRMRSAGIGSERGVGACEAAGVFS